VRTRFAGLSDEEVARELDGLGRTRDTVLDNARLAPGDRVLDVGAGTGLLSLGALDRIGENGFVYAVDPSPDALDELRAHVGRPGVHYLVGEAAALPLPDDFADAALTRSVLIYVDDLEEAAQELHRVLRSGGRLSVYEPLNRRATFIYDTVEWPEDLREPVRAEGHAYMAGASGLVSFNENELVHFLERAGFASIVPDMREEWEEWEVTLSSVDARLDAVPAAGEPSLRARWARVFSEADVAHLVAHLQGLKGTTLKFRRVSLFLTAVKP
jgi:arsenite methyltransferase